MTTERERSALLNALQRLYSRMNLLVLQRRMDSYREEVGSVANQDILGQLSDHIDRLAGASQTEGGQAPAEAHEQEDQAQDRYTMREGYPSNRQPSIVSRVFNELAKYFKSRPAEAVLHPDLSRKLQDSTWDHIHTALRLARQGQARTAKLHLDIADQALKEAAHYMPREDYMAFTVAVKEKLADITRSDPSS